MLRAFRNVSPGASTVVNYLEQWQRSRQDGNALRGNPDLFLNKFGHFQHLAGVLRWMFFQPLPLSLFIRLWRSKFEHFVQFSLSWFPLSPPCWAGCGDSSAGVPCPAYGAWPWHQQSSVAIIHMVLIQHQVWVLLTVSYNCHLQRARAKPSCYLLCT